MSFRFSADKEDVESDSIPSASPGDDSLRLEALYECAILDTDPEEAYDDLVLLASQICQTPIAVMSLVDSNRQWFKAKAQYLNISNDLSLSLN